LYRYLIYFNFAANLFLVENRGGGIVVCVCVMDEPSVLFHRHIECLQ